MKTVKLTSMNKMSYLLARGYFSEENFVLDENNRLVLVAEVEDDYKELAEEYRKFEEKNREFLRCFKQLKVIRNSLLEKRQEQEIEE